MRRPYNTVDCEEPPNLVSRDVWCEGGPVAVSYTHLDVYKRQVHLSVDREAAWAVGSRKADVPVILRVDAQAAAETDVTFYAGNAKVWLADAVPPEFIARNPE